MTARLSASAPPGTLDLLTAARDELDAIVAEGSAPEAAERLNGVAGLIEEAINKIERGDR